MTFEDYASEQGASRQDFGDAGLHMSSARFSRKQWDRKVQAQRRKDDALAARRVELRAEFARMLAAGEVREPTHLEKLRATAAGNPERGDVQAARRLLAKYEG
jgi:hypothetical protein